MTLRDFEFKYDNNYVVMEYYGLILNRTFWLLLYRDTIIGIQANGAIAVESGSDLFTGLATDALLQSRTVRGDISNPYSYIKDKYIRGIVDVDLMSDNFLRMHSNFRISRQDIKNCWHDPQKKWGMGYYPHDGKVYIETANGKKREFIVLGNESGAQMANRILTF